MIRSWYVTWSRQPPGKSIAEGVPFDELVTMFPLATLFKWRILNGDRVFHQMQKHAGICKRTRAGFRIAFLSFHCISLTVCTTVCWSGITAGSASCLGSTFTFSWASWPFAEVTPGTVNWFQVSCYNRYKYNYCPIMSYKTYWSFLISYHE